MPDLNEALETQLILLTRPIRALQRMGIEDVVKTRFEKTWHERPLAKHWTSTIGMWGGVATPKEIMERSGTNASTYKTFRQYYGLTARTAGGREQWSLAVDTFLRWIKEDLDIPLKERVAKVCAHFGILPIELRIYVDRITDITQDLGLIDQNDLLVKSKYEGIEFIWKREHQGPIDFYTASTYRHMTDD